MYSFFMLQQHVPFESIEGVLVIKYIEDYTYTCFIGKYAFKMKKKKFSVFLLNNAVTR